MAIQVFISYKWQDSERNKWVEMLYRDLRGRGIDAKLDKYEVAPGQSFSDYMTRGIRNADYVLFVITPAAVKAVESGYGALAFEMQIANARRLAQKHGFSIVPLFREGDATPTYLSDHRYLDFRNDVEYKAQFEELVAWLTGQIQPPPLECPITNTGYYVGPVSQTVVEECLRRVGEFKLEGEPIGAPAKVGDKGIILTWKGQINYTRLAEDQSWPTWWKSFYAWELEWSNEYGVVAVGRFAVSPD